MQRRIRLWPIGGLAAILVLAALACNAAGVVETDTEATVVSVYATITAQAATAGVPGTPEGAATATARPGETPTPTATEGTPTVTPTPPAERIGNGDNLAVQRCVDGITVDGDPADWGALSGAARFVLENVTYGATQWSGADDLSGEGRACWTADRLYVYVDVADNAHVQTESGSTAWKGDEVELVFDGDLRGDFFDEVWNEDDTQLGLSPGDFADLPPSAVQYRPSVRSAPEVEVAARRPLEAGGNYALEAAIPWSLLGVTPQAEAHYGFCLALSDNDQAGVASQDSMVSNCPNLLVSSPITWASIQLVE